MNTTKRRGLTVALTLLAIATACFLIPSPAVAQCFGGQCPVGQPVVLGTSPFASPTMIHSTPVIHSTAIHPAVMPCGSMIHSGPVIASRPPLTQHSSVGISIGSRAAVRPFVHPVAMNRSCAGGICRPVYSMPPPAMRGRAFGISLHSSRIIR